MDDRTTISVPDDLADDLHERKDRGESYADIIREGLDAIDTLAEMDDADGAEDDTEETDE